MEAIERLAGLREDSAICQEVRGECFKRYQQKISGVN
jgi:hypothetical protein